MAEDTTASDEYDWHGRLLPADHIPRSCVWCGGSMSHKHPTAKYCSKSCNGRAYWNLHKEKISAQRRLVPKAELAPQQSDGWRCAVDGCDTGSRRHGKYCNIHVTRLRKQGALGSPHRTRAAVRHPVEPPPGSLHDTELCAWWVRPCEHRARMQDLCNKHYNLAWEAGTKAPRFQTFSSLTNHGLVGIDDEACVATCLICGPGSRFEWRYTGGRGNGKHRTCIGARNANQRYLSTGWTEHDYDMALIAQGNRCAICGHPPVGRDRSNTLVADHCHATKATRKLLCGKCNHALGMLDDDPEAFRRAAAYLEQDWSQSASDSAA